MGNAEHEQLGSFANIAVCALCACLLTVLACVMLPGVAGAFALKLIALATLAVMLVLGWRISGVHDMLAGRPIVDVLETTGAVNRNRAYALLAGCMVVGVAVTGAAVAFAPSALAGHDAACLLVPVGLALSCAPEGFACMCLGAGKPVASGNQLLAVSLLLAAVGVCVIASVPLSPLTHVLEWGIGLGVLNAAVVCAWGAYSLHGARIREAHKSKQAHAHAQQAEQEARENEISKSRAQLAEQRVRLAEEVARLNERERAIEQQAERAERESAGKAAIEERCHECAIEFGLSKRQEQVLALIAQGYNRKRTAEQLNISVATVNSHMQNIYDITGIHDYQDLIEEVRGR